jgi:hypothetical protein
MPSAGLPGLVFRVCRNIPTLCCSRSGPCFRSLKKFGQGRFRLVNILAAVGAGHQSNIVRPEPISLYP